MKDVLSDNHPPKVAFLLIAYQQQAFIRDAIKAAFAQTYSPLEIILSDDASSDDTFLIMQQMCAEYVGPHTVKCRQNTKNLGLIGHLNEAQSGVDAELIVGAAGDDISWPNRVEKVVEAYLASDRKAHYLYSLIRGMDVSGVPGGCYQSPGSSDRFSTWRAGLSPFSISIGAAQAWTTAMVRRFGPMAPYVWAEDQILGFRGVLSGPVAFINEPLVDYRSGGMTNSKKKFSIKKYLKNQVNANNIYRQRAADALLAGELCLSTAIIVKFVLLWVALPISPMLSILRRRESRRRRRLAKLPG